MANNWYCMVRAARIYCLAYITLHNTHNVTLCKHYRYILHVIIRGVSSAPCCVRCVSYVPFRNHFIVILYHKKYKKSKCGYPIILFYIIHLRVPNVTVWVILHIRYKKVQERYQIISFPVYIQFNGV
jgi:uncharacterized membrane protein YwaF